jgi:hypothetical protein
MPDDAAGTIRAAVDAIAPPTDGRPGAVELGVHRHVVESIDAFVPGFVELLAMLLVSYATDVRPGAAFASLTIHERQQVLRLMSNEENPDMQDVIEGALVFTYGGMYSEWTGVDRDTSSVTPPRTWSDTGYHGPVRGHPIYREET